jgi:hypothetical protein
MKIRVVYTEFSTGVYKYATHLSGSVLWVLKNKLKTNGISREKSVGSKPSFDTANDIDKKQ